MIPLQFELGHYTNNLPILKKHVINDMALRKESMYSDHKGAFTSLRRFVNRGEDKRGKNEINNEKPTRSGVSAWDMRFDVCQRCARVRRHISDNGG